MWNYSNTSLETSLSASVTSSATTMTLVSTAGLPVSYPYSLVIDYGLATAEVVTVTGLAGAALVITRGEDGTAAQAHNAGASVVHAVVGRDLREPQQHIAASTDVHGVGAGSAVVGTTATQTLTNKTISGASNTLSNIADASIVGLSANKLTGSFDEITAVASADGNVALTVAGTAGATANALEIFKGATRNAYIGAGGDGYFNGTLGAYGSISTQSHLSVSGNVTAGNVNSSGVITSGAYITAATDMAVGPSARAILPYQNFGIMSSGNAQPTAVIRGSSGQTMNLVHFQNNAGTNVATVGIDGTVTGQVVDGILDVRQNGVSLPRGQKFGYQRASGLSFTGITTADQQIYTTTQALSALRTYLIKVRAPVMSTVASPDVEVELRLKKDGVLVCVDSAHLKTINLRRMLKIDYPLKQTSAGSPVWTVTVIRTSGSNSFDMSTTTGWPFSFIVQDIGDTSTFDDA